MAKFLVIAERTGIWKVTVALSVGVSDTWQNMLHRKNMMKNIQNGNLMICRLFQIYGRCRCLKTRKNSLKYYAD